MRYLVEFSGEILVEARDDIDAEGVVYELPRHKLVRAIDDVRVLEATERDLREHLGQLFKAEEYL